MPPRIKRPASRARFLNWEAGLAIGVGICAGAYIWPPIFREVSLQATMFKWENAPGCFQVTGLDKLYEKQELEKKEAGAKK